MTREPDMTLLMTASGSLAHRKILPTARAMLSIFATYHAQLKIVNVLSSKRHALMLKVLFDSHRNTF